MAQLGLLQPYILSFRLPERHVFPYGLAMMKAVVFMAGILFAAPFVRAQDTVAEDSDRAALLTPEALGRTVYQAIAKNIYPQLRAVSALSLDIKEIETIANDIIKAIEAKLKNGGFKNADIGRTMLKSIREDLGSPEKLTMQMKDLQKKEPAFKESLATVRAQAITTGVDWAKAKYLKTDASNAKQDEDVPLRTGDLFIHFTAAGKEHRIRLPGSAKTPRWGWMLGPDELQLDTVKNK